MKKFEKFKISLEEEEEEKIKHPTTYLETLMHIFKGNVGSGMFAMGDAFKNAGMAIAPWLIVCVAIVAVHTQHILINASNRMKEELQLKIQPDYAETVQLCFANGKPSCLRKLAPFMRNLVKTFLCMAQLGFCCVYFVFISTNIKQTCDYFGYYFDVRVFMAMCLVPILGSCIVRNLKYLTPFSTIANGLMLFGVVATLYYSARELPPLSSAKLVAEPEQYPLFFGTTLFAVEGISLVLPLQREMRNPRHFNMPFGVLNVGMTIIVMQYILVGFLSYLKYGEDILGSVTLNLPPEEILSIAVKITLSIGIMLGFALQFYIPVQIIYNGLKPYFQMFSKYPKSSELSVRVFLVLLTFTLAATVPYLELFISLVGSFCSCTICLIIPPMVDLVEHWNLKKLFKWTIIKDFIILTFGVLICISGSWESLRKIIETFGRI